MKYIKTFENKEKKYWLVSTKIPRKLLSFGLKNIGLPNNDINKWCDMIESKSKECDSICAFNNGNGWGWSYSIYYGQTPEFYRINWGAEFMGILKVTEMEIDAEKYNM